MCTGDASASDILTSTFPCSSSAKMSRVKCSDVQWSISTAMICPAAACMSWYLISADK